MNSTKRKKLKDEKVNFCFRVDENFRKKIKILAAKEGMSIQDWLVHKLDNVNTMKITCSKLCQECGDWKLKWTKTAALGTCDQCKKEEVPVFPCHEKVL